MTSRQILVVEDNERNMKLFCDILQASGFGTLEGFIAAKVMVEGLRRAGRNLTRESFVRAMEGIQDYDAGGFKVTYGPGNRSGSKFVDLTIISKDQKFVR